VEEIVSETKRRGEGLIQQVERLRESQRERQAEETSYRDGLERPTMRAIVTDPTGYMAVANPPAYTKIGKHVSFNAAPGTEYVIRVRFTVEMDPVTAGTDAPAFWIFRLVQSGTVQAIDYDRAGIARIGAGANATILGSVTLQATVRPPANKTARYEVQALQNVATTAARMQVHEQVWEVTPRRARMGESESLHLV
jgi:hypothetical protein